MNTARPERSRSFWIWGFVFLLLLHAAAVFRFGERKDPVRPASRPAPFLYASADEELRAQLAGLTAFRDPTLFALPHPRSFSGAAWLSFQPDIPKLTNWSAPREWLELPTNQLGSALREHLATNRLTASSWLAAMRAPGVVEVRLPGEPVVTNSTVRVEGPLVARGLLSLPTLPAASHHDVLRRTMISVAVDGEGLVETVVLSGESGSPVADARALELARQFQFRPLPLRNVRDREMAPPTIGRLVFAWQVVPATNGVPAAGGLP